MPVNSAGAWEECKDGVPCGSAAAVALAASQNAENEEVTIPLLESETYHGDVMDRLLRFLLVGFFVTALTALPSRAFSWRPLRLIEASIVI